MDARKLKIFTAASDSLSETSFFFHIQSGDGPYIYLVGIK